jgi:hypothetical protein
MRKDIKPVSSWKTIFYPCQKEERKEKLKKKNEKNKIFISSPPINAVFALVTQLFHRHHL